MKNSIVIGSVGDSGYLPEEIDAVLQASQQRLQHGGTFTGKPGTQLHVTDDSVLKLKTDGGFDTSEIARSWCTDLLDKSRKIGLYHPAKTWFIHLDKDIWRLGNIAPRMEPLHMAIEQVAPRKALEWLLHISIIYLRHASDFHERLDEGLSNFGLAKDGLIYYLDDDFYPWDHYLSFSAMLAGWFRKYSEAWLDKDMADDFGKALAFQIQKAFSERDASDMLRMLYEHLGFQFTAGKATEHISTFREALLHPEPTSSGLRFSADIAPRPVAVMDEEDWFHGDQPVALLADIHANMPALEAVMSQLAAEGVNHILVAGDIVGYGPHPAECIDALRAAGAVCLRGNHDHAVGSGQLPDTLHGSRMISLKWTSDILDGPRKKWLMELPLQWHSSQWLALHGAPRDPTFFNAYVYDRTAESNLHWMIEREIRHCVHGHSHLQGIYWVEDKVSQYHRNSGPGIVELQGHTLICPGSVGQPRSGVPGTEYAILYPDTARIDFRRVSYDMEKTMADMKSEGLPDDLIQRLRRGQ